MKRLAVLTAAALVIAACGDSSDEEVATLEDTTETTQAPTVDQEIDAETALLEFASCMRDNGVPDFPDPSLDDNGNLGFFGGPGGGGGPGQLGDRDTVQAAFEACGDLIDGVIQNVFRQIDQTEFQDNFLEFAQCMRDQGVDMPDPDFSGGFGPGLGRGLFGDIDPRDPAFQEAAEECQDIFEGTLGRLGQGGLGPGGDGNR